MNNHEVFTADGVIRQWIDKRTGEEVENLLKWRKTTGISWSRETALYPAKVWVYFFGKIGERSKLWISFDSDSEAEKAFEKADALRDAYLRSPAGNAASLRQQPLRSPQSNSQRKLEAEDLPACEPASLRPPSIDDLGEPPEYDPSDNPF